MGAYQCSKCGCMLNYYGSFKRSRNYSCRIHSYDVKPNKEPLLDIVDRKKICTECRNTGNCRHKFQYQLCGGICC